MSLVQLIHEHALSAAEAGNWSAVAATLNGLTTVVRDPTPVTYARIRELFGEPVRQIIAASIRAIAKSNSPLAGEMEDLHTVMLNEQIGVRLDLDERQTMLSQIGAAAGWDQQLVTQIAALGVRSVAVVVTTDIACRDAFLSPQINSRIINASALAKERILTTDTAEQLAAKWAQAWAEAV